MRGHACCLCEQKIPVIEATINNKNGEKLKISMAFEDTIKS